MSVPRENEDRQSLVEGIVAVQDYGLGCAWQKHKNDIKSNPEWPSLNVPESSGLAQPGSGPSTSDLSGLDNHWTDKKSCIEYFQTALDKRLEYAYYGGSQRELFLPLDKLVQLLHGPIIRRAFKEIFRENETSVDQMVNEISFEKPEHSRLIILATLIYAGNIESLGSFIDNGIHDVDLPLRRCLSPMPGSAVSFHKNGDAENSPAMSYFSSRSGSRDLDFFCLGQYQYLIPFFDMSPGPVRFYRFDDPKIRLPFIESFEPTFGGYATVRRVKIHPAHHNYEPKNGNHMFAVKEISANFKLYKDEIQALVRFSGQRSGHDHLIRLLVTVQHGNKYYLIFPLAHGNLLDLWQQKEMSPTTPQHVEWVLDQCLGITGGLWKIHHDSSWTESQVYTDEQLPFETRGRHGDIKPHNILFFSTPEGNYRLVITDFGLTRFHSAGSVSNIAANRVRGLTYTYRPPEIDMKSFISQAYDMWSLGCVFLEFISWLLLGYDKGRREFTRLRTNDDITRSIPEDKFFNIDGGIPVVKPSVTKWIRNLRNNDTCPSAIKYLLDIIEEGLLQPYPQDRWKVNRFHDNLKQICDDYKEALNEPRDSNAVSTLAVFNENYDVVGHLRGPPNRPFRRSRDRRQTGFQRTILDQTNMRRETKNSARREMIHLTSPNEGSEETDFVGEDAPGSFSEPVEEGKMRDRDKMPNPATPTIIEPKTILVSSNAKPFPLRSVGKAFKRGYARLRGVLRRLACI